MGVHPGRIPFVSPLLRGPGELISVKGTGKGNPYKSLFLQSSSRECDDDQGEDQRQLCQFGFGQTRSSAHGYDEAIMLDTEGMCLKRAERIFYGQTRSLEDNTPHVRPTGITRDCVIYIAKQSESLSSRSALLEMSFM